MPSDRERRTAAHVGKIRQALLDKKLVIIVGAGITLSATHPSPARVTWTGLIQNGLEYLEEERFITADNDELRAAQNGLQQQPVDVRRILRACHYLRDEMDHHRQFPTWLDAVFGSLHEDVTHPEIFQTLGQTHQKGAKLLTTNFDDLLERFCSLPSVRPSIADDVRKYERGILNGVFHIHGSYLNPEDVVLDAVDYYKVKASEDVQTMLRNYIAQHTILFVGCGSGLEDPNFGALLKWASDRAQNIANHHYLLVRDGDDLRYDPLVTLRYGQNYGDLVPYLRDLLEIQTGTSANVNTSASNNISGFLQELNDMDLADAEYKISLPIDGTCNWISKIPQFVSWIDDFQKAPMLCIHGHLGSGKSTLIRHILSSLKHSSDSPRKIIVAFFVGATDDDMPHNSPAEIYRSFLVQIFRNPSFQDLGLKLLDAHMIKLLTGSDNQNNKSEMCRVLKSVLYAIRSEQTIIFLDGLDKCTDPDELIRLFQDVASTNYVTHLKVVFTSQQKFPILESICTHIAIEDFNHEDIALYIEKRLPISNLLGQQQQIFLQQSIKEKASGIFLWVVLVVNLIRRYVSEGRDYKFLAAVVHSTPKELTKLYRDIISRSLDLNNPIETRTMAHVLQWTLFSARPLSLGEWHHVLAFVDNHNLGSIEEWKRSPTFTESDTQLLHRILRICCGLVDAKDRQLPLKNFDIRSEAGSLGAGAGSFESLQHIDVIHSSVHTFFLDDGGFTLLNHSHKSPVGEGHAYILDVCVRYCFLEEMKKAFQVESQEETMNLSRAQLLGKRPSSEKGSRSNAVSLAMNASADIEDDDTASETMSLGSSASVHSTRPTPFRGKLSLGNRRRSNMFLEARKVGTMSVLASAEEQSVNVAVSKYLEGLDLAGVSKLQEPLRYFVLDSPTSSISSEMEDLKVVDNPPDLWQYCQDMLVYHAVCAEKAGVVPGNALDFLVRQDLDAWAATRKDMQHGATLEYFAAQWNLVSWLQYLTHPDARYIPQGGRHRHPIIVSARYDCLESFEYLLKKDRSLALTDFDYLHRTALHYAAMRPNSSVLQYLTRAESSLSVNPRDIYGRTPIHLAALYGSCENVKALLSLDASAVFRDRDLNTPLHLACLREEPDISICEILIGAGCNEDWRNKDGKSSIQIAQMSGNSELFTSITSLSSSHQQCEEMSDYDSDSDGYIPRLGIMKPRMKYSSIWSSRSMHTEHDSFDERTPLIVSQRSRVRSRLGSIPNIEYRSSRSYWRSWLCCC